MTYSSCWQELLKQPPGGATLTFCKDFPMCIPQVMWEEAPLDQFIHTFLIRHPSKSLASMLREVRRESNTSWSGFDPDEAGYTELESVYTYITQRLQQPSIILDSDEVAA